MEGKCPEKGHSRKGVKKKKNRKGQKERKKKGVGGLCVCVHVVGPTIFCVFFAH